MPLGVCPRIALVDLLLDAGLHTVRSEAEQPAEVDKIPGQSHCAWGALPNLPLLAARGTFVEWLRLARIRSAMVRFEGAWCTVERSALGDNWAALDEAQHVALVMDEMEGVAGARGAEVQSHGPLP